jgi:hypothetical protein
MHWRRPTSDFLELARRETQKGKSTIGFEDTEDMQEGGTRIGVDSPRDDRQGARVRI